MKSCPKCDRQNLDDAIYCSYCGVKMDEVDKIPCPQCGNINESDANFCYKCGADLQTQITTEPVENNCVNTVVEETKLKGKGYSLLTLALGILGSWVSIISYFRLFWVGFIGLAISIVGLVFTFINKKGCRKDMPGIYLNVTSFLSNGVAIFLLFALAPYLY